MKKVTKGKKRTAKTYNEPQPSNVIVNQQSQEQVGAERILAEYRSLRAFISSSHEVAALYGAWMATAVDPSMPRGAVVKALAEGTLATPLNPSDCVHQGALAAAAELRKEGHEDGPVPQHGDRGRTESKILDYHGDPFENRPGATFKIR